MNNIVIGSRGSALALIQTNHVKDLLENACPDLEIKILVVRTKGDLNLEKSLEDLGGKGAFTSALEIKILEQNIDLAVHSLKDLPMNLMDGLIYVGSPNREDARDVFVSNKWKQISEIPQDGIVATGSIRRKVQLLAHRPDLNIQGLRGNIDTRLKKLDEYGWDGIITAAAAMHRLGLQNRISEYLDHEDYVPAAGQGALGLEIDSKNENLKTTLNRVINKEVTSCCKSERLFLTKMEGGCQTPIGCFARMDKNQGFMITGYVASMDGKNELKKTICGDMEFHDELALELAREMINDGAMEMTST